MLTGNSGLVTVKAAARPPHSQRGIPPLFFVCVAGKGLQAGKIVCVARKGVTSGFCGCVAKTGVRGSMGEVGRIRLDAKRRGVKTKRGRGGHEQATIMAEFTV